MPRLVWSPHPPHLTSVDVPNCVCRGFFCCCGRVDACAELQTKWRGLVTRAIAAAVVCNEPQESDDDDEEGEEGEAEAVGVDGKGSGDKAVSEGMGAHRHTALGALPSSPSGAPAWARAGGGAEVHSELSGAGGSPLSADRVGGQQRVHVEWGAGSVGAMSSPQPSALPPWQACTAPTGGGGCRWARQRTQWLR